MATSNRRKRSPLLGLVFGAAVTLAVITAAALVILVDARLSDVATTSTVRADRELVRAFIATRLTAEDLDSPVADRPRVELAAALGSLTTIDGLRAIIIFDHNGVPVAWSDGADGFQTELGADRHLAAALHGSVETTLLHGAGAPVLREYVPVVLDGDLRAVVLLEREASAILAAADDAKRDVLLVAAAGTIVLAGLLFLIFRAAHERLARQSRELVEATRRDPLTGLPNHGAVVESVTDAMSEAARDGGWLVVALLDVDNFALFNATHGHVAGDAVLRTVAGMVRDEAPASAIIGRYGPDEFLISGPVSVAHEIRPAVIRIRERLAQFDLRLDGPERLPVTISAGISSYPEHAGAVTELLAAAALTLREAKVGGGDTIRVETPPDEEITDHLRTYGVLRGLVTAIDNKDHYTRRHSEEVAYYALLLADELGMDEQSRSALRLAALLHDVGKIGIPDSVLRKPGPFTDEERRIMEQHTVIGDLILRGLPLLEATAPCVRAHHERWDGGGYPDGLRGDDIPRIARFVSVADAFSAMTTSRSYRVRLPVSEALGRIRAGAGSQFDPILATAFVDLIERRPTTILETTDEATERLWAIEGTVDAEVA